MLLVDDHRDSLDLYQLGLSHYGFETCGSTSADTAFEISCTELPDAIVTDLALPVTDGFALIRRLRSDSRTRDIPIIAVSGHAGAKTRAEVLAAGAGAFFPKPCSVQDLERAIRRVLQPRP